VIVLICDQTIVFEELPFNLRFSIERHSLTMSHPVSTSTLTSSSNTTSAPCPRILYGTAFKGPQTYALVTQAITLGYRGIDTAGVTSNYDEAGAGNAIRDLIAKGVVTREEIYVRPIIACPHVC